MQGIITSALNFGLVSWALSKVGPLFVASYIPVESVSSTVLALIFLKSTVYLGRYVGRIKDMKWALGAGHFKGNFPVQL